VNDEPEDRAPLLSDSPSIHDVPATDPQACSGCYRFESFEIDGVRRELRRHGLKIHLKGRPFTLLKVLVESQGRVVTREELRGHLWSSDTHVDFDANLTTAFYKVRKALGDSSKGSRFIETIPGLGYRFIEPILPIKTEPETLPQSPAMNGAVSISASSSKISPRSRLLSIAGRRLLSLTIAGLALLIVARAGYITAQSSGAAPPEPVRLLVLPFVDTTGNAADEHFSDGLNDELITDLTRQHGSDISVIAQTTAMSYKHADKSVQEIARELKVSYVVEGDVQRDDGRVHISARLVRAADQSEIWADSYDRPFGDSLDIESELASRIGDALSAKVIPTLPATGQRVLTSKSYGYYLKRMLMLR
jgi:TolB-like protein/DNA-binding winged helix-turn-helix (wHTH) protein